MTVYDKLRTPFFEITVIGKGGTVTLPPEILRLVQRLEIIEIFDNCSFTHTANINILEGSREPFSYKVGEKTSTLYDLGENSGDSIENRPGVIPDLRFSKGESAGLTSIPVSASGIIDDINASRSSISSPGAVGQFNPAKSSVSQDKTSDKSTKYLFQEGTELVITWGYKELELKRKVRVKVMAIQTDFAENGQTISKLTCADSSAPVDSKVATKSVNFVKEVPAGTDSKGNPIFDTEDKTTKEVIEEVCSKSGMDCIVSEKLRAEKLDKGKAKVWVAGESFYQFLKQLSQRHAAYFGIMTNPDNGKPTIIFISKEEFEKQPNIDTPGLLTYKGKDSIIKSVSVNAAFNGTTGHASADVDSEGNESVGADNSGSSASPKLVEKQIVEAPLNTDFQNSENIKDQATAGLAGIGDSIKDSEGNPVSVGNLENIPEGNSSSNMGEVSTGKAACRHEKVSLDFVTLGFPELRPGTHIFRGLGNRLSGGYKIFNVSHIIEPNRYMCKGHGTKSTMDTGLDSNNAPEMETNEKPQDTIDVQITNPVSPQAETAKIQLDRLLGLA